MTILTGQRYSQGVRDRNGAERREEEKKNDEANHKAEKGIWQLRGGSVKLTAIPGVEWTMEPGAALDSFGDIKDWAVSTYNMLKKKSAEPAAIVPTELAAYDWALHAGSVRGKSPQLRSVSLRPEANIALVDGGSLIKEFLDAFPVWTVLLVLGEQFGSGLLGGARYRNAFLNAILSPGLAPVQRRALKTKFSTYVERMWVAGGAVRVEHPHRHAWERLIPKRGQMTQWAVQEILTAALSQRKLVVKVTSWDLGMLALALSAVGLASITDLDEVGASVIFVYDTPPISALEFPNSKWLSYTRTAPYEEWARVLGILGVSPHVATSLDEQLRAVATQVKLGDDALGKPPHLVDYSTQWEGLATLGLFSHSISYAAAAAAEVRLSCSDGIHTCPDFHVNKFSHVDDQCAMVALQCSMHYRLLQHTLVAVGATINRTVIVESLEAYESACLWVGSARKWGISGIINALLRHKGLEDLPHEDEGLVIGWVDEGGFNGLSFAFEPGATCTRVVREEGLVQQAPAFLCPIYSPIGDVTLVGIQGYKQEEVTEAGPDMSVDLFNVVQEATLGVEVFGVVTHSGGQQVPIYYSNLANCEPVVVGTRSEDHAVLLEVSQCLGDFVTLDLGEESKYVVHADGCYWLQVALLALLGQGFVVWQGSRDLRQVVAAVENGTVVIDGLRNSSLPCTSPPPPAVSVVVYDAQGDCA